LQAMASHDATISHDDHDDLHMEILTDLRRCPVFGSSWSATRERPRCWRPRRPCSQDGETWENHGKP
jgi:hypothetical protein